MEPRPRGRPQRAGVSRSGSPKIAFPPNGLLLRSDIHKLFDKGYVGVTPDHHFVVSKRLKDDFANGRSYYPLHGQVIRLPERVEDRPSPKWLEWHVEEKFRR